MRPRLLFPAITTAISLVILIALGAWQWRRMGEKELLIATIHRRIIQQPAPLPADWTKVDLATLAYQPVVAEGRFDHAREAHVFFSLSSPVGGISGPGYLIVTPLLLADGGTILVNRGFVPAQNKDAATRSAGQIEGAVRVGGLLRQAEARNRFSGADDPGKNIFFVRDPETLARAKGIANAAPMLIDLRTPKPPGGLPVPNVTQIDIPNNHFQYAMTWWSLAGVLAIIFGLFARQRQE